MNFLSFDHTTGRLVIEGTATVSADGKTVRTDPGTGVTHPGWHGLTPPGGPAGPDGPPAVCAIDLGTDDLGLAAVAPGRSLRPSSVANTITLNLPKALPLIVGETGALSDPALIWRSPPAGDACGLKVQIEVDGPLVKFIKKTGNLSLKSQTFTLRPGSSKTKTFSGVAKTYDEIFGKGQITKFISDELYGARITVRTSRLKSTGPPDVTVDTYYLYRWVNVNYPPGFLGGPGAAGANATAAFRKTLNDGSGGWSTIKSVLASLPTNSATLFSVVLPPLSPKTFDASSGLTNHQFQWEFDPHAAGEFKQDMSIQVDDGYDTVVGKLTLLGHGIDPTLIDLNLDGYKAEMKRVILSLRNITARPPYPPPAGFIFPIYEFSASTPGLPPVVVTRSVNGPGGTRFFEDSLNFVSGGATNYLDGLDLRLGTSDDVFYKRWVRAGGVFQQMFLGFMPENRNLIGIDGISGSPDDDFDSVQLAALDALIDTEANKLPVLVAQQFDPVNVSPNAIQFVDTGATINCQWTDVFVTLGDGRGYGTASPGRPVYGVGAVGQDVATLRRLLPDPKLPLGAKFWALAEALNVNATNQISLSVGLNVDYSGPDNFAAYVATSVSHEIGHTLGLLDAYTNDRKVGTALCRPSTGNCIPFDIMQTGQSSDPFLLFAPGNIGLLKAAVGVTGTRTGPLSVTRNEPLLLAELSQYRKTFNLGHSSTGIRENNPMDPPPTVPEISVFQEDNSFFGEADEALEISGEIAADGSGGDFIDLPFTILNSGYGPLTLNAASFLAGTEGFAVLNASAILGQPITAGRSVTLTVRFDPLAGGAASDTLQLTSDAASMPLLSIPITATAYASAPTAQVELVGNNNLGGAVPGTAAIALPEIFRVTNAGQTALRITAISFVQGAGAFTLRGVPANLASQPIQLAHGQSFTFGGSFQADQPGLRRALIEITTNDPQTPVVRVSFVGTGLNSPVQADWGDDFVAIESPDFPGTPPLRAKSDDKGNFEFFLPSQVFYHLVIFDPVTGLVGHETDSTEVSGQRTLLVDTMVFRGSTEPDSDYDGLPDDIEFAIGTNPNKADADGDGVDDFAAISQGLDPFGGRALPLGIVGQVMLQGEAKAVVVVPSSANGENPVAVVAAGTGGLAMIDVGKPTQPIFLNQLPLPGDATDVAVDFDLRIAAVAAGAGGLHLIDIADPASPRLLSTCFTNVEHVEVVNGVAYAVSGTFLLAVDLLSREAQLPLALPGSIVGMTREGTMLYLTDQTSHLRLVDVSGGTMKLRGQLAVGAPFVRSTLNQPAVGNGIAYLTLLQAGVGGGGYATVDVSNPDAPQLISGTGVLPAESAPGNGIALNGSGLGLLIGSLTNGFGSAVVVVNRLDVMNVSDPAQTYVLVTSLNLPAPPLGVSIAQGVAYVACGSNGLVMVNYLSYDGQGQPPTVSLSSGIVDADLTKPGMQVVEGTPVPINATVRDDVQSASVELLVNGQVTQTRTSFPFNLEVAAPSAAENGGRFTVQVRATDTGGNAGV
ncbi:MAG: choice-of-anchor D domain-containing protein, partial [Verrucomicrobiota bacterium]